MDKNNTNMVYMTTLSNARYIPGLKALKKSLKKTKTKYNLIVLIPENAIDELKPLLEKNKLLDNNCKTITKPNLNISYPNNYNFVKDYWNYTYFKIQSMSCYQFNKIILLDSDLLILKNIDELFLKPNYSAVLADTINYPNIDYFNSGVMVIEPNKKDYEILLKCLETIVKKSIKYNLRAGDQDVFNLAHTNWLNKKDHILPEIYNSFFYEVDRMVKKYKIKYKDVKVLHFTGSFKPWNKSIFYKINLFYILSRIKHFKFFQLANYIKYILYSR